MRLTQKKIEEILLEILGEGGKPLVDQLYGKENVSEFELATKTKKDIKIIRRMLYTLYNHNIVGFIRKKDQVKGWYIYYWTIIPENVRFAYVKKKKELLEQVKRRLEEEKKELFFICQHKCVRFNFDQATDFEFHCTECGELVSQDSGEEKVIILKQQIKELEADVESGIGEKKIKNALSERKNNVPRKKKAGNKKSIKIKKRR